MRDTDRPWPPEMDIHGSELFGGSSYLGISLGNRFGVYLRCADVVHHVADPFMGAMINFFENIFGITLVPSKPC